MKLLTVALAGLAALPVPSAAAATPKCIGERATIVVERGEGYGRGTKGADVVVVHGAVPIVETLAGDDLVCNRGGNAVAIIESGPGDDVVEAGPGNAFIGSAGGDDLVRGGPGGDNISDGPGNDRYQGGRGHDLMDFPFARSSVRANLGEGIAITGDEVDAVAGFEALFGSTHNDLLIGSDAKDIMGGDGGEDRIIGLLANDVLFGSKGRDSIDGGGGRDRCDAEELSSCERRFPPEFFPDS